MLSMNIQKTKYNIWFFLFEQKEVLLRSVIIRWLFLVITLVRYWCYKTIPKDYYAALRVLLRYERDISGLSGAENIGLLYARTFRNFIQNYIIESPKNLVLYSYVQSKEAQHTKKVFQGFGTEYLLRMKYPKENDDPGRQGDVLLLKPYISSKEKGVIFVQYDEGVKRFASIYDIDSLGKYYRFVIEPSTCGYQNPMFFLCLSLETEVIFESQYKDDFDYIQNVGFNFIPIRLGAGDWVDLSLFNINNEVVKEYDLVMIANWLKWKRHGLLFKALLKIRSHVQRVALIGYPIEGRTLRDTKAECKKYGLLDHVDFFDKIPHKDVLEIIKKSKVGILLSKEEGANRGIYECFFSNVPVILTKRNRGVNRDHINRFTGVLADDLELQDVIVEMVNNFKNYNPKKWAFENTGYINSTNKLNQFLKELALEKGEEWTQDIFFKHNSPHARYAKYEEQEKADVAFDHLEQFLRN